MPHEALVCMASACCLCMAQEVPATDSFNVTNDGPLMRRVCDELAKAPADTALEADVKAAQGFSGKVRPSALQKCRAFSEYTLPRGFCRRCRHGPPVTAFMQMPVYPDSRHAGSSHRNPTHGMQAVVNPAHKLFPDPMVSKVWAPQTLAAQGP